MAKYKIDISPKLEFLIYFGPLSMKEIDRCVGAMLLLVCWVLIKTPSQSYSTILALFFLYP